MDKEADKADGKKKKKDKKSGLGQLWEQAVSLIIRPQRAQYDIAQLGPSDFHVLGRPFQRIDFSLPNGRGHLLQCSWYRPAAPEAPVPAVIYLHGNSGCRCDADDALHTMLPYGVSVFTFDFSGSGQSGGEYVSLGFFEKSDVTAVVAHLRTQSDFVSTIGLWGRSTATAILYAHDDPSVAGMVLDSPFSDLPTLCEEVAQMAQVKVPKAVLKNVGMPLLKKAIQKRARFDVAECSPRKYVAACFVPALFCHGEQDDFIAPRHSLQLCDAYAGEKNRILVKGGHNTVRPSFMRDSASIFFAQCLGLPLAELPGDFSLPVGLNTIGEGEGWDVEGAREAEAEAEDDEMAAAIALSLREASNSNN